MNLAGHIESYLLRYGALALVLTLAGTLALVLWRWHGPVAEAGDEDEALM